MATRFPLDIAVHSPQGELIAAVEIKNREGMSTELATQVRRNYLAHGQLPVTRYFLLIAQDRGFLWTGDGAMRPDAPPTHEFPMEATVRRYLPQATADRLRGSDLELLVMIWLSRLANEPSLTPRDEAERVLAASGFLDAIRDARLSGQAAA